MNYYILYRNYKKGEILCESTDMYGIDQYDVSMGIKVDNWNSEFTFYYNTKEGNQFTDFIANDLGWFIVSTKVRNTIIEYGIRNIQFLPLNIKNINENNIISGYFVANLCGVVDALDLANSKYIEHNIEGFPKMISVTHYALKLELVSELNIFRLKDNEDLIFVSEEFKKTIIKNGITGCWFKKVLVT